MSLIRILVINSSAFTYFSIWQCLFWTTIRSTTKVIVQVVRTLTSVHAHLCVAVCLSLSWAWKIPSEGILRFERKHSISVERLRLRWRSAILKREQPIHLSDCTINLYEESQYFFLPSPICQALNECIDGFLCPFFIFIHFSRVCSCLVAVLKCAAPH